MNILITGGSGDLGQTLVHHIEEAGHTPVVFDVEPPREDIGEYIRGSLLSSEEIRNALRGIDMAIHIAAWHGIHEVRGWKTPQDFWDLNVNGTYNLLQACVDQKVTKLIHISSSSVTKSSGYYGFTKRLAEVTVRHFQQDENLEAIILRPRAFIPHWNRDVYSDYLTWAKRFWPGAVHITDVIQAVMLSVDHLSTRKINHLPVLNVDRDADFPQEELSDWDMAGPGTSFQKHYPGYENLINRYGLDTAVKPVSLDIQETKNLLGYQPAYGLQDLLEELSRLT